MNFLKIRCLISLEGVISLLPMIIYKRITYLYGFYKIKTKSPKTWSQDKQEENITVQINFLLGFLVSFILL